MEGTITQLDEMASKAIDVKVVATAISEHIERITLKLREFPAQVRAQVSFNSGALSWGKSPGTSEWCFLLTLGDSTCDLRVASVPNKIAAAPFIPLVIDDMQREQDRIATQGYAAIKKLVDVGV
jgi:hypothetical protein